MRRWTNWWTEQALHEKTRLERLRKAAIRRKEYPIQAERDWFCRAVREIRYLETRDGEA